MLATLHFFIIKESPWPQPMSKSSELHLDRGGDRVGEGCVRYRFDFIGHGQFQIVTVLNSKDPLKYFFLFPDGIAGRWWVINVNLT